jgi:hypothetical protein
MTSGTRFLGSTLPGYQLAEKTAPEAACAILDAIKDGRGAGFSQDEVDWALQLTGDLPLPDDQC